MKRNKSLNFTKILYGVFIIRTIISLFIAYKKIDSKIAFTFLMGYLFFTIFMILYVPIITILNLRRLKWDEIRKRIIRFSVLFILLDTFYYGFNYFMEPSNIDLLKGFSMAFGSAFGLTFIDITFLKKNEKFNE